MANKKISELDSRASLSLSDLLAVGDPTTGYLYKITITDLKTLTGAGVISFNGRVGSVTPAEGDYTLNQLGDVIITSPSNNQLLQFNGSNWVNATIDLSGYVPYSGATGSVNLGSYNLTATNVYSSYAFSLTNQLGNAYFGGMLQIYRNPSFTTDVNYSNIFAKNGTSLSLYLGSGSAYKQADINLSGLTNNTLRTYSFPDASGTIALTSDIPSLTGYVPYTGATADVNTGAYYIYTNSLVVTNSGSGFLAALTADTLNGIGILNLTNGGINGYLKPVTLGADRTWTLPNASGTIALTSDIPSLAGYVPTSRTLTINGTAYDLSADRSWTISSSQWTTSGGDIYFNGGNVGINTASPTSRLTIGRVDSTSEGGQIDLCRASDNANAWGIDVFGSTSTPSFRIIDNVAATTRFTISGAGNVGIGTSNYFDGSGYGSTARYLTILNSSASSQIEISTNSTTNDSVVGGFDFINAANAGTSGSGRYGVAYVRGWIANASGTGNTSGGYITFGTKADGGNQSERMRITSTGSVLVGTSSSVYSLSNRGLVEVNGTSSALIGLTVAGSDSGYLYHGGVDFYIAQSKNNAIIFSTNAGTERMRITGGGNVGIGSVGSSIVRLVAQGSGTSNAAYAFIAADSAGATLLAMRNDGLFDTGTRAASPYNNTYGNAANVYIGSDGVMGRSTSSIKYKTDVKDYDKGLAEVLKMRPVYYKSKHQKETGVQFAGLIAEEIHNLGLTEFVQYADDKTPDALAYQNMVSLLVKAIQEQQIQIEQLKNK